jgi:hypothetical protein
MEGLAPLNQRQRLREIARAGRSSRSIAPEKISRDSVRNLNKHTRQPPFHSIFAPIICFSTIDCFVC